MNSLPASLIDGVRAAFLLRTRGGSGASGSSHFIALLVVYVITAIAVGWLDSAEPRLFNAGGLLVILADALLTLVSAWILVTRLQRPARLWDVAAVMLAATIAIVVLIDWPLGHALPWLSAQNRWLGLATELLRNAWWLLVLYGISRMLVVKRDRHAASAALLAFAASGAIWWFLPGQPIFYTQPAQPVVETASATVDPELMDEPVDATIDFNPEQLMFDQPRLLAAALDRIKPREPGKTNLYVLSFAGDGSEDVFRNEAEYVEQLFSQRFDNAGRVLTLVNNPSTLETRPLATLTNLRIALDALAKKMDPAQDILLLFLTSHGSEDHQLYVNLEPLPLDQIGTAELQEALRTEPALRWKVLVVSACYSGGFVETLRDDATMVITASRADRTSFGCGSDSDITWFGKAFFADALNRTASLREAFELARRDVAQWEKDEKIDKPSDPQIASSRRIEAKLDEWQRGRKIGAAVPFVSKREDGNGPASR